LLICDVTYCVTQEAALIRIKEEVKKNRELLDRDGDLPQEDELYRHLATAENSLIAKDNILQVRIDSHPYNMPFYVSLTVNLYDISMMILDFEST